MNRPNDVRDAMLGAVPSLRAFAISVCGNMDRADDLVQETLLRAWANLGSFQPGTNMSAWLFTILRNLFRSEYRKRRREVEDADGSYAESLTSLPDQNSRLEIGEFREALKMLPPEQRESLLLVRTSVLMADQNCRAAPGITVLFREGDCAGERLTLAGIVPRKASPALDDLPSGFLVHHDISGIEHGFSDCICICFMFRQHS